MFPPVPLHDIDRGQVLVLFNDALNAFYLRLNGVGTTP